MKIGLKAGFAALALAGAAAPASAAHFVGDYNVTAHSQGAGLLIETVKLENPLVFDLLAGATALPIDLFTIFTDESWVNGDDLVARPIGVNFTFTAPSSANGGIGGTTTGHSFYGILQWGELKWNNDPLAPNRNPAVLDFGSNGKLQIQLNDVKFSKGLFGLNGFPHYSRGDDDHGKHQHFNGCGHVVERFGATVTGTFSLSQVSAVPEPATWAYLIVGFAAVGAAMRKSARTRRSLPALA